MQRAVTASGSPNDGPVNLSVCIGPRINTGPGPDDDALRERMRELARKHRRFGSPRLHALLRREELVVNHKRTERIYRQEGLAFEERKGGGASLSSGWRCRGNKAP